MDFADFFRIIDDKLIEELDNILTSETGGNKNGFGKKESWETDHLKHLIVLLYFFICDIEGKVIHKINTRQTKLLEAVKNISNPSLQIADIGNLLQEILKSNLPSKSKEKTSDLLMKEAKNLQKKLNEEVQDLLALAKPSEMNIDVRERPVVFSWIDYLSEQLGSRNKAFMYVSEHPLLRRVDITTMERAYYRSVEKKS